MLRGTYTKQELRIQIDRSVQPVPVSPRLSSGLADRDTTETLTADKRNIWHNVLKLDHPALACGNW